MNTDLTAIDWQRPATLATAVDATGNPTDDLTSAVRAEVNVTMSDGTIRVVDLDDLPTGRALRIIT